MDLNFFKQTRILDGGMGQELLARGMEPNGTLWSANALLQEKYHKLLLDTHIDFIKAGAEVIVTTTFTTRQIRLKDNNVEDKFEYLNKKAGEIAQKAKKLYPNVLIAGGLPPQYLTYEADPRPDSEIADNFKTQAELLNPNSTISPKEVVKIQLSGLQQNDLEYKDSGIEQTWKFAHPNNKRVTGPLSNFKMMIKSASYGMMINHLSHTITQLGIEDNWAQFEVVILDKNKIYHKFNWQVEKYTLDGALKDCWLTTMVSNPIPLGSSI